MFGCEKREIGNREYEKREIDKKYIGFDELFDIRERKKK